MWNMVKANRVHPPTNSPEVIRMLFCLTLFCVAGKLSFAFKTGACMPPCQVNNRIQADNHSFNQSCAHEALTNTFVSLKSFSRSFNSNRRIDTSRKNNLPGSESSKHKYISCSTLRKVKFLGAKTEHRKLKTCHKSR